MIRVYVNGKRAKKNSVKVKSGEWMHLCVAWDNARDTETETVVSHVVSLEEMRRVNAIADRVFNLDND